MKTNFVTQDTNTTFVIDRDGERWLFEDAQNFTSETGPAIDARVQNNVEIVLEGHASTRSAAGSGVIDSMGQNTLVVVTSTGTVFGDSAGVAVHGEDAEIDNRGHIVADFVGVNALGDGFYLANRGVIVGGTIGIYMTGADAAATNYAGAEIRGMVSMSGAAGSTQWFNNFGTVSAPRAIDGGDSNDIVYNTGELRGTVSLGAGDDVLDTRRGDLSDTDVAGGTGNDLLITGNSGYRLEEAAGEGTDTVKTNVDYVLSANVEQLVLFGKRGIDGIGNDGDNQIYGNGADNRLKGEGGNDILDGGLGNDRLEGNAGTDTFVFSSGYDMDRIVDFTHGEDTIDLSNWTRVGSFDAFLARAEDHGNDIWVSAGKDMLVIKGQQIADMDASDFSF